MVVTAAQLRQLYYSSPIEEESTQGWGKATIKYAIQNKKSIMKYIHSTIRNYTTVGLDAEDIFQSFMLYLYNAPDYDIGLAYNGERTLGIKN